jgi:hypothetical protein
VVWHVNDWKISHVKPAVVTRMVNWLKRTYQQIFDDKTRGMRMSRGKVHEYLGMTLDFTVSGEVKLTMILYVKDMIRVFSYHDPGEKVAVTMAAEHLFQVNNDTIKLDESKARKYHTFVAKLLFLTTRARPDIHTAAAFLTTWAMYTFEDDWKKLVHLIGYLRGTAEMPLTLRADDIAVVKWWVDGSHAVHPGCRSHTGGTMLLGKGSVVSTSLKQKINTKSSTEMEVAVADDLMPHICWTNYFLECHGYNGSYVWYQDNKSATLLENNGLRSSGKRT